MYLEILVTLACFVVGFLFSHRLVLIGMHETEVRWQTLLRQISVDAERHSRKSLDSVSAAISNIEKLDQEFQIISARFHHIEKRMAGMTKTIKHDFVSPLPIEVKDSLLKRAGVTK